MSTIITDLVKGMPDWHLTVNDNMHNIVNEMSTNTSANVALVDSTGYGVISGLTTYAQATPNMTVGVLNGVVHLSDGTRLSSVGSSSVTISNADASNPRIDIIYLKSDATIGYLVGTPLPSPVAPSTPTGGFLLSQIYVSANATNITSSNITDKRKMANTTDGLLNKIGENTQLMVNSGIDQLASTGKFITKALSWIGIMNEKYLDDNGTRFYLIPKNHVSTGVGGCIKIFADNYVNGDDYRDWGMYFSADQNGDKGYYGNGVNWINVKVLDSGAYAGKHPDLAFSFQDGHVVAGRITCFDNSRAVWVFGSNVPTILKTTLIAEFQGNIGCTKGNGFKLMTSDDSKSHSFTCDTDDTLKISILNGEKDYISGVQVSNKTPIVNEIKNALVTSSRTDLTTDGTTLNVTGVNRVVINQPSTGNNISSITGGVDGQEIVLINVSGNSTTQHTTIVHNTGIKLLNGVNYPMGFNHTLTLINISGAWYEKCRSTNN